MKKSLIKLYLLFTIPFALLGCSGKKDEPITDKEESTIIKDAKSVDPYLKKKEYKSIAYAFIYKIKEGLTSYESETNGTVSAKVAIFDYNIKYNSVTHKKGNAFYSRDHSTSTLMNVENEFYMADRDKILVSRDMKKYNVYTVEDYQNASYAPSQYLIMGYVFNDESIINTEVVSDRGEEIAIKYTLDNELSTKFVKTDLKVNGGLTSYPKFESIEFTLTMKRDFTPISYAILAHYEAAIPIIGSAKPTQTGECIFSKINENITIPNETFLAEKLGAEPSKIVINDEEDELKSVLLDSVKNLDFANGVDVSGKLKLNLLDTELFMDIKTNLVFDISKISEETIYKLLNIYAKIEGDEQLNSLLSIIKLIGGSQLGDYANIFDEFKSLEAVYDGEGSLYLMPLTNNDTMKSMFKLKLTDVVDLLLKRIKIGSLINGANNDYVEFKKVEGKDKDNYRIKIVIRDEVMNDLRKTINDFFENSDYSIIKTILGYEDLESIDVSCGISNSKIKDLDVSIKYTKTDEEKGNLSVEILALHLDAAEKKFDFETPLVKAKESYEAFTSIADIKARMTELSKNVYASRIYLSNVDKALEEFTALTDMQKDFVGRSLEEDLKRAKQNVLDVIEFSEKIAKFDLDNLNNQVIYEILKLNAEYDLRSNLLKDQLGDEKYSKCTSVTSSIDYSSFESALPKIDGDDEKAWNLTKDEIAGIKFLFDISEYYSSVTSEMMIKGLMSGKIIDTNSLKEKIQNLYKDIENN